MNASFCKFGSLGKLMNFDFEELGTPGKFEEKKLLIPPAFRIRSNESWGAAHTRFRCVGSLASVCVF